MATLYVRKVPDDLYEALRKIAKLQHRSIAAEVLVLLRGKRPNRKEPKRRRALLKKLTRMRPSSGSAKRSFPSIEEMLRVDRDR